VCYKLRWSNNVSSVACDERQGLQGKTIFCPLAKDKEVFCLTPLYHILSLFLLLEVWNLFFVPSKIPNGARNAQAKRLKSLQDPMCIPERTGFLCPTCERFGGRGLGTGTPQAAGGTKAAQPWMRRAQAPGAEGTFFLSMMSVLSLPAIRQSLLGCHICCRHKFGFLLGEFITLNISHDRSVEMKSKVAQFLATNLYMNMSEFPVTTV